MGELGARRAGDLSQSLPERLADFGFTGRIVRQLLLDVFGEEGAEGLVIGIGHNQRAPGEEEKENQVADELHGALRMWKAWTAYSAAVSVRRR